MRSKNAALTKAALSRMAKASRVIAIALRAIFVATCIFVVLLLALYFYQLGTFDGEIDIVALLTSIAYHVLTAAVSCLILFVAIKVFDDIARGTSPFTEKQASRIRLIGILLVAGVVLDIPSLVIDPLMVQSSQVHLGIGPAQDSPTGNPELRVNMPLVYGAALSFFLSYVFKYGALLQRLSDDTV
ncbi:hypothetical protein [Eggerthella guodeyinii]|uniref:DUF2975 domain-containing protein n=1 Tax=Eggerthella guodeyinii TaxID=2690837 RepID=A0A6N7RS79_9ACTN|nr:hypothetical protein [Eggerthella guodeyinii]MRX83540.1 hypothetical protein [Eggerthella guodeyinii]